MTTTSPTPTIEVSLACMQCGKPVEGLLHIDGLTCASCAFQTALPEADDARAATTFSPCCVCGSKDLYAQRDFNRPLGIALAAIGLALGPWTQWISTVVAIGLDALLFLLVPSVVVCYACNAQYRGVPKSAQPEPFEIAIHDVYKFNRRHPPRREFAVAGPLQKRLQSESGGRGH